MRRIGAIGLIGLLSAQPLLAAGPLARSIDMEASRLAALPSASGREASGWNAVQHLDPGTSVLIDTANARLVGKVVSVDGAGIAVNENGGIQRIDRENVITVERHIRRGDAVAAGLAAAGGLWFGSAMAVGIGLSVRCQPNCGAVEAGLRGAVIGIPIAAGYGAWRATSRIASEVIYRAPARQ